METAEQNPKSKSTSDVPISSGSLNKIRISVFIVKIIMLVVIGAYLFFNPFDSDTNQQEWDAFKRTYSKSYENHSDESNRMKIFEKLFDEIIKHNERYDEGKVSFKMAVNKFADLMDDELYHLINRQQLANVILKKANIVLTNTELAGNATIPESIDWRDKGAVTNVKDQITCGSCWAFSATGTLEGQHFRKTGHLVSLSEQNLIDCSTSYNNDGCDGGLPQNAFEFIRDNGGIQSEESYPYEGMDNFCRYDSNYSITTVRGFVQIPTGDEEKLKEAIALVGPISVAIDASLPSFRFYASGVYYDPECDNELLDLNHAALAVGYGTDQNGLDYFIVKNNWGSDWGDNGYIKMVRNRNNSCGIATLAQYPLI